MKSFLALLCLIPIFCFAAEEEEAPETYISLPSAVPVIVETSIYLYSLDRIDEKGGTFDANVYLDFTWHDDRLSFTPSSPNDNIRTYVGENADAMIKQIWWPQMDFLNEVSRQNNNTSLYVHANGTVQYSLGITASFRTALDYRRFPFDRQTLNIQIDSFQWNKDKVIFVPKETAFEKPTLPELNSLYVTNISATVESYTPPLYQAQEFSTYVLNIDVSRNPAYYIYQMLIPLFLVMGICFCAFFFPITDLPNKVYLALTGILAFFWTKFSINEDLPRIGYMTILDKAFLISYLFGGLTVLLSTIEHPFLKKEGTLRRRLNTKILWGLPLLYLAIMVFIYIFS
jgi:hypothetical protein